MSVKITDIKTIMTAPEGINLLVVKVLTSEPGLYGLGCATFAYRHLSVAHVIENYLNPLLVGRDVENIEQLWQLMHQNAYWRSGPIENNAVSGVDMALWDIKGKMAKMPLYQLLGGKCREGVRVYRHVEGNDASEIAEKILAYKEQGVTCIRCQRGGYGGAGYNGAPASAPVGSPDGVYLDQRRYLRDTVKLFADIRDKIGFSVDLCHDVHERINPADAIKLAKELEPASLFFLEDVVPPDQAEWLRMIRAQSTIPIAQGELFNKPADWQTLIQDRLINYIRVHLSQIGGITPARKLQVFAEAYGIQTAWHGPGDMSPVGHAANIHLDLSAPNFGIQEWSGTQPPNFILQELHGPRDALLDVFPGMPECRNGYVYANDKPGLGIDINEYEAEKYPCKNEITLWTQTRRLDGTLQVP
jgi:mannonate dehydratase